MLYQLVPFDLTPFKLIIMHYVAITPTNTHKNCIQVPHLWYRWESKKIYTPKEFVDIIPKYRNHYWCRACQKPLLDIQKHSIKLYMDEWYPLSVMPCRFSYM